MAKADVDLTSEIDQLLVVFGGNQARLAEVLCVAQQTVSAWLAKRREGRPVLVRKRDTIDKVLETVGSLPPTSLVDYRRGVRAALIRARLAIDAVEAELAGGDDEGSRTAGADPADA